MSVCWNFVLSLLSLQFFGYLAFVAASLLIVLRKCVLLCLRAMRPYSPKHCNLLMRTASIAIWNKEKSVIAIAAGVWVINLGFQLQGKPLHPVCRCCRRWGNSLLMCDGTRSRAGE